MSYTKIAFPLAICIQLSSPSMM